MIRGRRRVAASEDEDHATRCRRRFARQLVPVQAFAAAADVDPRDHAFIEKGNRTAEGFFYVKASLEQAIAYIEDDELVEVTPTAIRLRKRYLDPNERKRNEKRAVDSEVAA